MSESSEIPGLLVAGIIGVVLLILLFACCCAVYQYPETRIWKRFNANGASVANSCWSAMKSCLCCCGVCLTTAGRGVGEATVNGATAVATAARTTATESEPYRWLMCSWLGWLVHNVLCCCCCGPRTCGFAFATAEAYPEPVPGKVVPATTPPERVVGVQVEAEGSPKKGGSSSEQQQSELASATTPLLALAV